MERELAKMGRRIARQVVEGVRGPFKIDLETLPDYLGPAKLHEEDESDGEDLPGIVSGLARAPAGGEVMVIEATRMRDEGLQLTGQLGDVMTESARLTLSYIRAHAERFATILSLSLSIVSMRLWPSPFTNPRCPA